MCYHKSEAQKFVDLTDHYSASFQTLNDDLEPILQRFEILIRKDDTLNAIGLANTN
jgi:hypothetical protein